MASIVFDSLAFLASGAKRAKAHRAARGEVSFALTLSMTIGWFIITSRSAISDEKTPPFSSFANA